MTITDNLLFRVLYIDLNKFKYWVESKPELFEEYIGGTGVAIRLLTEECPKNADPLGPENVIAFAIGPLTVVYPLASKTVALFKSPLTGNLGESHAGGRSAMAIRMAGYGAIVIKGASEIPIILDIRRDKVEFHDASALWGMHSTYTVGRIVREKFGIPGFRTIMRIGRAGEKLIRYASVVTETYRHFGRLGLGAVLGSKKIKAIIITGKRNINIANPKEYRELYAEIYNAAVKSPVMKKYHDLGTPANVIPLNEIKALPTRNLTSSYFEGAETISGEYLAEHFLGRRVACAHCPVGCIHLAALREPYEDEPYFYKTKMISYDYELIYSLGSMLGISNSQGLLKLIDEIETEGLDAMSTGVVLAWATEAYHKGLISENETMGLKLTWGDYKTYIKAIKYLIRQPNEFYKTLALGSEAAAKKYGGLDFALSFGGNEMPGYHTGPAAHIGHLLGSRHSHLDMGGYSLDQKLLKTGEQLPPEEIAKRLLSEEEWRQILSSLVVCFFARGIYTPEITAKTLKTFGYNLTEEDLKEIGRKIHREKYKFKIREGFDPHKLRIPERIFETPTSHGKIDKKMFLEIVEHILKLINI